MNDDLLDIEDLFAYELKLYSYLYFSFFSI